MQHVSCLLEGKTVIYPNTTTLNPNPHTHLPKVKSVHTKNKQTKPKLMTNGTLVWISEIKTNNIEG